MNGNTFETLKELGFPTQTISNALLRYPNNLDLAAIYCMNENQESITEGAVVHAHPSPSVSNDREQSIFDFTPSNNRAACSPLINTAHSNTPTCKENLPLPSRQETILLSDTSPKPSFSLSPERQIEFKNPDDRWEIVTVLVETKYENLICSSHPLFGRECQWIRKSRQNFATVGTNCSRGDMLLSLQPPAPPPLVGQEPPASNQSFDVSTINTAVYLDVQDQLGKWVPAQVVYKSQNKIRVSFEQYNKKYDEAINIQSHEGRQHIASLYSKSSGSPTTLFKVGEWVDVYIKYKGTGWTAACIQEIDQRQILVRYVNKEGRHGIYWLHVDDASIRKHSLCYGAVTCKRRPDKQVQGHTSNENQCVSYEPSSIVSVSDTYGKWLPAEITAYDPDRLLITVHYLNWGSKWDEVLHVCRDHDRIRALGEDIPDSEEEILRAEQERKFREDVKEERGFDIVSMEKDGNCLFRSVAHQIYGDAEKHGDVRKSCFNYMEENKAYFSKFTEDFDEYIRIKRMPNEWGDHLEIQAMGEVFNKRVEIIHKHSISGHSVMSVHEDLHKDIGILRLSYHEGNHYNSVVDPASPFPLGDGNQDSVRMRLIRLKTDQPQHTTNDEASEPTAMAIDS